MRNMSFLSQHVRIYSDNASARFAGSDCGAFTLANAEATILGSHLPKSVTGFREAVAQQLLRATQKQPLEFPIWSDQTQNFQKKSPEKVVLKSSGQSTASKKKSKNTNMSTAPDASMFYEDVVFLCIDLEGPCKPHEPDASLGNRCGLI